MRTLAPIARSLVLLLGCALSFACQSVPHADLILTNGTIITLDDEIGDVEALAIRDGRVLAAGSGAAVLRHHGPDTRLLDLQGAMAMPGFIEGHGHFTGIGHALQILDLRRVQSWDEVVAMVAAAVEEARPDEWILGRGWHQEKWTQVPSPDVEGFPTHESLSAVSPDNPVCLTHASGHACFFNARAMELAGVDGGTADPPGGEILHTEDGQPSGVFRETASALVQRAHAASLEGRSAADIRADLERSIRLADRECLENGVTSFQDAGSSLAVIDAFRDLAEAGELGTRLYVMIRASNEELEHNLDRYRMVDFGDHHLTVRSLKRSIDGALGSRGAWLLEPYSDLPDSTGLNTATVESVTRTAELAVEFDYQLCVHAIGDRANREVLDIYEQAFARNPGMQDHRWRVEHAQHLHPDEIPRFAELGVVASMQGVHCTSDAPYVIARLGERRAEEGAYVWRKLMESGALISNGTDAPVEDISPIECFHSTVTRRLADGSYFYPDQRMNRIEGLKSYTLNCAMAAFEERDKGTLTPGKLADVAVLDRNLVTVPDEEILDARVLYTIVGGEVLYQAEGRPAPRP